MTQSASPAKTRTGSAETEGRGGVGGRTEAQGSEFKADKRRSIKGYGYGGDKGCRKGMKERNKARGGC